MAVHNTRHEDWSDSEIIRRCFNSDRQIIGGRFHSNLVVKLSEEVVVKFGWGVTAEEAHNQRKAFELLDPTIVRVPQLYRYFTQNVEGYKPRGFIVMEYVHGEVLKSPNTGQIDQIAQILSYFSSIHGQHPGPLQTGVSRGILWQENGEPVFKTIQQMERWLNFRLPDVESKLALEQYPLVLCHLDLAPRNFISLEDGSICLVDWASAGFYPRLFEICLLKIMESTHGDYEVTLIERAEKLTGDEQVQMLLLVRSFHNGIRHPFVSLLLQSTTP
jgi:aminoglycoside phosphotransferase (APT) family kinase protein